MRSGSGGSCPGEVLSVALAIRAWMISVARRLLHRPPQEDGLTPVTLGHKRYQKIMIYQKIFDLKAKQKLKSSLESLGRTNSQSVDNLNDRDKGSSRESRKASMRSLATAALRLTFSISISSYRPYLID